VRCCDCAAASNPAGERRRHQACSIANFVASEKLVFRAVMGAALLLLGMPPLAAGPEPTRVGGPKCRRRDARLPSVRGRHLFALDGTPAGAVGEKRRERARDGCSDAVDFMKDPSLDGHLVPGATVEQVVGRRSARGKEADFYDDAGVAPLSQRRSPGGVREGGANDMVTHNTEHIRTGVCQTRATRPQRPTKIAELTAAGTPGEREKAPREDRGFLWGLRAWWRYEAVPGGVLIECESVSLSRSIPIVLRPFVTSTVDRIARESLEKTLRSVRAFLIKP
jgi:hypothetical protein